MVLGLLDQWLIFSQWYLIEMLGFLTGLGLLELCYLIYPRLLKGFVMLVFFTNVNLMEFQVGYLALFFLFSVIDSSEWFWIESLHKNNQLMLEFHKGPFLVLHFFCCILRTFLMMLSVKLLYMLMILLSYCKCDLASEVWQQLELASELESDLQETVDWGKKWLVDCNAGKFQLVSFDRSNNSGSVDVKMGGSVLEEKSSFKMLGLIFSSQLDWSYYIISIAKTAS